MIHPVSVATVGPYLLYWVAVPIGRLAIDFWKKNLCAREQIA